MLLNKEIREYERDLEIRYVVIYKFSLIVKGLEDKVKEI